MHSSRWQPLLDRLERRVNPVLVKEVRQSLRGKYFSSMYWLTLCGATLVAAMRLVVLGDDDAAIGDDLFLVMAWWLSAAVHLFIPVSAFLSLSGEWDEGAFDMLALSGLRPRNIVLGKVLAALIQVFLYYCSFLPFFVFCGLLEGLDLRIAAVMLASTLLTGTCACTWAMAFASLTTRRVVRFMLLAIMTVLLVMFTFWTSTAWTASMSFGAFVDVSNMLDFLGFELLAATIVSAFGFAVACARISHPEENGSTPLRILSTTSLLALLAWTLWLYAEHGNDEILQVNGCALVFLAGFFSIFFATEPESLGRRVKTRVPRSTLLAVLLAAWLPGGGRGMLFFLWNAGGMVLTCMLFLSLRGHATPEPILVSFLYSLVLLGLPTAVAARRSHLPVFRLLTRVTIPFLAAAGAVVPSLLGFFLGYSGLTSGHHVGNIAWILSQSIRGETPQSSAVVLLVLGLVTVIVNARRVHEGLDEVIQAARSRSSSPARGIAAGA